MKLLINLLFLVILIAAATSAMEIVLCVDNHNNVCQQCDKNVTLDENILIDLNPLDSKKVILCSTQVSLLTDIVIKNTSLVWVVSHFNSSTITCANSNIGINFVNVKNVTIRNITVENCGAEYDSTSLNTTNKKTNLHFKTSIYFLNCTNIAICGVSVIEKSRNWLNSDRL